MSGQPRRPLFSEGQILAAADLTLLDDDRRRALALHDRTMHGWGIADGLELEGEPQAHASGAVFQQLAVRPGVAVDGTGRQIIVPERTLLREAAFEQVNGTTVTPATRDTWFPVLLSGRDKDAPVEGISMSRCGTTDAPSRVVEEFELSFGRAGDELDLDDQVVPGPDAGPADPRPGGPWRVLVGFVRWNPDIGRFSDFSGEANGVRRRYAGVKADEVTARSGRVEVRSRVAAALGTPAVVVDEEDGGRLYFGLHDGAGSVTPLLTVSAKGDVTAEGTLKGVLTGGTVQVQSGVATDGVVLPLPPGITEDQVASGQVTLHVTATVHTPPSLPVAGTSWATPLECEVEADRRVRCRVRWFTFSGGTVTTDDVAAACDYLVLAAVSSAPEDGGGS